MVKPMEKLTATPMEKLTAKLTAKPKQTD